MILFGRGSDARQPYLLTRNKLIASAHAYQLGWPFLDVRHYYHLQCSVPVRLTLRTSHGDVRFQAIGGGASITKMRALYSPAAPAPHLEHTHYHHRDCEADV